MDDSHLQRGGALTLLLLDVLCRLGTDTNRSQLW